MSNALGRSVVTFPDEGLEFELGTLWEMGLSAGGSNSRSDAGPIAMLLTNTSASIGCLLGAIRAGIEVVSLPLPPRTADLDWYQRFVIQACEQRGATSLLVDSSLVGLLPPLGGVHAFGFDEALSWLDCYCNEQDGFRLVQFTSGSTADPRGVVLSGEHIVANVRAILARIEPEDGDATCSWLPISHDMGLIGMLFCSLLGGESGWANKARLVLIRPETFLRRPATWLELCGEYGSTITASPNFGLDLALRHLPPSPPDLNRLRMLITGGEPVRSHTLSAISESLSPAGFSSLALSPAYGLAEAALAISVTSPQEHWSDLLVDVQTVVAAHPSLLPDRSVEVVSAGRPLDGYKVEATLPNGVGELLVSGPSLLDSYSDGQAALDDEGFLHTSDIGFVQDNNVFVIGRSDDVFLAAGKKIYPYDVEDAVGKVDGVRAGRCACLRSDSGELVIIAETSGQGILESAIKTKISREIKRRVNDRIGRNPGQIHLVEANTLPLTSSGKLRRPLLLRQFVNGEIDQIVHSPISTS